MRCKKAQQVRNFWNLAFFVHFWQFFSPFPYFGFREGGFNARSPHATLAAPQRHWLLYYWQFQISILLSIFSIFAIKINTEFSFRDISFHLRFGQFWRFDRTHLGDEGRRSCHDECERIPLELGHHKFAYK